MFPHLSVLENVAFGLRSRGTGRAEARARAGEQLDRFELTAYADAKPAVLSGGQAQRVAVARALATRPGLLLLDEPLAALDAATRQSVRADLRRQLAGFEGTRILVTHDPIEAMVVADRLVIVEAGHVVQAGTANEISRHPRSSYVASLVGVNLYRGRVEGRTLTTTEGGELYVTSDPGVTSAEVFATIRPAAVALYRQRPDGTPRNVWPATVVDYDLEGERVRVQLAGPVPVVAEITPAALADLDLRPGEQCVGLGEGDRDRHLPRLTPTLYPFRFW